LFSNLYFWNESTFIMSMWHNRVTTLLGDLYSFGAWSCNKNDTIEQQGLKEGLLELVMATLNFYNNDFHQSSS